jgi:hypothetical protein
VGGKMMFKKLKIIKKTQNNKNGGDLKCGENYPQGTDFA